MLLTRVLTSEIFYIWTFWTSKYLIPLWVLFSVKIQKSHKYGQQIIRKYEPFPNKNMEKLRAVWVFVTFNPKNIEHMP